MSTTNGRRLHRSTMVCCVAAVLAFAFIRPALAEYRLAPGDVVEIAVAGVPDQHHRVAIQPDGSITLPGVGPVVVGGMTQAELQAKMEMLLPSKIYRYRTPDGVEHPILLRPTDITTSIAEYRPIYISGDVLTPGQQTYRPLMTVRQVVAVAGGYSLLRSRATQTNHDPIELKRDYELAAIDYVKNYVHAARLQAELQDKEAFQQKAPYDVSVANSIRSEIVRSETESLRVSRKDFQAEQAFLEDSVKKADDQLGVLKTQEEDEAKGVQSDAQDLDRISRLFNAGNVVSPRVTEARRALLLSSTRHLQTTVEVMRLQRQKDEQQRQLERLAAQRKIKLLSELNDTNVRLSELSARLQATRQRLQPSGAVGPMAAGVDNLKPEVAIVRKIGQNWTRTIAGIDTEVQPGDVIEVALRAEAPPSQ